MRKIVDFCEKHNITDYSVMHNSQLIVHDNLELSNIKDFPPQIRHLDVYGKLNISNCSLPNIQCINAVSDITIDKSYMSNLVSIMCKKHVKITSTFTDIALSIHENVIKIKTSIRQIF